MPIDRSAISTTSTTAARAAWAARDAHVDAAVDELRRLTPTGVDALILALNDTPRLTVKAYRINGDDIDPETYDATHDEGLWEVLDEIATDLDMHDHDDTSNYLPTDHPNNQQFIIERTPAPTDQPWNGTPHAQIHGHTNPWIRDPHGTDLNLTHHFGPHPTATNSPCGECGPLPGILAPMDTDYGIQRCDACNIYPGDLDAAAALAAALGPGHQVWFHGTTREGP